MNIYSLLTRVCLMLLFVVFTFFLSDFKQIFRVNSALKNVFFKISTVLCSAFILYLAENIHNAKALFYFLLFLTIFFTAFVLLVKKDKNNPTSKIN